MGINWTSLGFQVEESTCQCRRHRRQGFNPWIVEDPLEEGMATHSSILFIFVNEIF